MLAAKRTDILARLRAETRSEHDRLERGLGYLEGDPSREQVRNLLMRFHGFFVAWEPALSRYLHETLLAGRRKLPLLRQDLRALGLSADEIETLPICSDAAPFRCPAGAMGSLYVLEGSTLGGQLISRRLADAPWMPSDGLAYFRPYGSAAGEMWRTFRRRVELASSPEADGRMITAASRTFSRLEAWLCHAT